MMKQKRTNNGGAAMETLIGAGTTFQGDISFEGGIRVDGTVEGTISAPDDSGSRLVITDQAKIKGEVRVPHVVVNGSVVGNVHSSERLELQRQARVEGDLYYEVIQMEEGASVTGTCAHVSTTKEGGANRALLENAGESTGQTSVKESVAGVPGEEQESRAVPLK